MHKRLDVWKQSVDLVTDIYQLTQQFPSDEKFGLTNQIRRAAVSIPSNIAEGAARQSNKEFIQFLYIALGSCSEVETQLTISHNLHYCHHQEILAKNETIKRMLQGLIKKRKSENV
ncbi:MAG: four helix bundle protein [Campylobacterota bacterium]|nr:four helix bundle protein [Campylobacterota bacterium]